MSTRRDFLHWICINKWYVISSSGKFHTLGGRSHCRFQRRIIPYSALKSSCFPHWKKIAWTSAPSIFRAELSDMSLNSTLISDRFFSAESTEKSCRKNLPCEQPLKVCSDLSFHAENFSVEKKVQKPLLKSLPFCADFRRGFCHRIRPISNRANVHLGCLTRTKKWHFKSSDFKSVAEKTHTVDSLCELHRRFPKWMGHGIRVQFRINICRLNIPEGYVHTTYL